MFKFVILVLCVISTTRCQVYEKSIDLPEDTNNSGKSLKNFVYLWEELQTPEGQELLAGILRNNETIESYCSQAWEMMTKMDFLPQDEFTAGNKNKMMEMCKGKI